MIKKKISLFTAILVNINIVIGGAFFLGAGGIMEKCGPLSGLVWVTVGVMLLPLVLVLADLSSRFPVSGGLYIFSKETLSPFWGFVAGWSYFIGTAAGNALILHAFASLLHTLGLRLPFGITELGADIFFIVLFGILNAFNIQVLTALQRLFTGLKTIPFIAILIGAFFAFDGSGLAAVEPQQIANFAKTIPLVFFAYVGIEACCAIGHIIEDGKKNTSKAILISFGAIILIYAGAQWLLFAIHNGNPYDGDPFSSILPLVTSSPSLISAGTTAIYLAMLSSFLGGFYSMFYSNNWNLFAIAESKEIILSSILMKVNRYKAPIICIIVQGMIMAAFLAIARNVEVLAFMSDFGAVLAYLLSVVCFWVIHTGKKRQTLISITAGLSCAILLYLCIHNLWIEGLEQILPFLGLVGAGFLLHLKSEVGSQKR